MLLKIIWSKRIYYKRLSSRYWRIAFLALAITDRYTCECSKDGELVSKTDWVGSIPTARAKVEYGFYNACIRIVAVQVSENIKLNN